METKTRVLIAEPGEDLRNLLASHIQEDEGMELDKAAFDTLLGQVRQQIFSL